MVQNVNEQIVSPEEQLSDRVYHYDAQEKVFELASDYEQRVAEKETVELEAAVPDKGIGAWSAKMQSNDSVQAEASGTMKVQQSVPEMGKEGHLASDSREAVKPARSESRNSRKHRIIPTAEMTSASDHGTQVI